MEELRWMARPILAAIAVILWSITLWSSGETPPEFLTGLVATAWGFLFVSREVDKKRFR